LIRNCLGEKSEENLNSKSKTESSQESTVAKESLIRTSSTAKQDVDFRSRRVSSHSNGKPTT